MKPMNIPLFSVAAQRNQSLKKSQSSSPRSTNDFDNMLASSIRGSESKKRSLNENGLKNNDKMRVNVFRETSARKNVFSQGEVNTMEDNQNSESALLALGQGLEELLQRLMQFSEQRTSPEDTTYQETLKDIMVQVEEIVSTINGFSTEALSGLENKNTMDPLLSEITNTLALIQEIGEENLIGSDFADEQLKLQGILEQHLEKLQSFVEKKEGIFQSLDLSPDFQEDKLEQQGVQKLTTNVEETTIKGEIEQIETMEKNPFERLLSQEKMQDNTFEEDTGDTDGQPFYLHQSNQSGILDMIKNEGSAARQAKFENILNQISTKMQIHTSEEGSEMSLQLKPDHLGKLAMKISIERGIVVAKFMAESQMVKEVIESNFSSLKDALNEKGLGVQELSVYVGSDSNFQQRQNSMLFEKRREKDRLFFGEESYGSAYEEAAAPGVQAASISNIDFLA